MKLTGVRAIRLHLPEKGEAVALPVSASSHVRASPQLWCAIYRHHPTDVHFFMSCASCKSMWVSTLKGKLSNPREVVLKCPNCGSTTTLSYKEIEEWL